MEEVYVVVSVDVVTRWSTNDSYEICKLICYKKKTMLFEIFIFVY